MRAFAILLLTTVAAAAQVSQDRPKQIIVEDGILATGRRSYATPVLPPLSTSTCKGETLSVSPNGKSWHCVRQR